MQKLLCFYDRCLEHVLTQITIVIEQKRLEETNVCRLSISFYVVCVYLKWRLAYYQYIVLITTWGGDIIDYISVCVIDDLNNCGVLPTVSIHVTVTVLNSLYIVISESEHFSYSYFQWTVVFYESLFDIENLIWAQCIVFVEQWIFSRSQVLWEEFNYIFDYTTWYIQL